MQLIRHHTVYKVYPLNYKLIDDFKKAVHD